MYCPKCSSTNKTKSGFTNGKQRYKCKDCNCNYTKSTRKGKAFDIKLTALKLYLEGMGFRSIGRILGISNVAVLKWIKTFGKEVKTFMMTKIPNNLNEIDIVKIDEMWHFTSKKNENCGFGLRLIEKQGKLWDFQLVVEGRRHLKNFITK